MHAQRSKASSDTSQNIVSDIPTTPQYCTSQNIYSGIGPMSQFPSGLWYCINSKCMSQSQLGLQDYSTMSDYGQSQTGFMPQCQTCNMPQSQIRFQDYSTMSLKQVYRSIVPCLNVKQLHMILVMAIISHNH